MNQQSILDEISQYLDHARLANMRQDENTERDYLQKSFDLIERLSYKARTKIENELYYPYRNMARFRFTANQFGDCINYIDRAISLPEYKNEVFDNKINMKLLKSHSYLMLFLEQGQPQYMELAQQLLDNIETNIKNVNNSSLLQDFSEKKEIYSAITQNNLWTTTEFELPFPIIASEGPINFFYKGIKIKLQIEVIDSPYKLFNSVGNGFTEILEDKYGLANRSKVSLSINQYIHPESDKTLVSVSENNRVSLVVAECIEVLNFFIERFRVSTDQYWLETISHKMLSKHSILIKAGNQVVRNVVMADSTSLFRFSPSIPWITEAIEKALLENLNKVQLPLWESLFLDAKDYFLRGRKREAIVSLNSAFENFLAIEIKKHLAKGMSSDEIKKYLEGQPNYDAFFLKDYLSKEKFTEAVNEGVINNNPPSTFAIIKKCNQISSLGVSNRQLQKLISKIRSKRNDVVHGKENIVITNKEVKESIESFEELIKIFS